MIVRLWNVDRLVDWRKGTVRFEEQWETVARVEHSVEGDSLRNLFIEDQKEVCCLALFKVDRRVVYARHQRRLLG